MIATDQASTNLDLDGLIEEAVEFKLLGQVRRIKPMDVATMFKFTNSMEALAEKARANAGSSELIKSYCDIFSSCVEPFSMDDLLKMRTAQMMSLYGLILRRVYGEDLAKTFDQKKKTIPSQEPSQQRKKSVFARVLQRLSRMRVFFSGGDRTSV